MQNDKLFNGIDTIILRVRNTDLSKKWYQEKLGLQPVYEDHDTGLVVLDTGTSTSLSLWQTAEAIRSNGETSPFPIFSTSNAALAREMLQQRGVETSEMTSDGSVSYFMFYDPDGNLLEACQVHT